MEHTNLQTYEKRFHFMDELENETREKSLL